MTVERASGPAAGASLAGRRILITGAASGIGAAIADRAARAGAHVIVSDLDGTAAEPVAARIRESGNRAEAMSFDVREPSQIRAAIRTACPLHGLVCNAGVSGRMPIEDVTIEHWDEVLAVNLRGAFFCVQAAAESLARNTGSVVGICSTMAHLGVGEHSVYAASKGGLEAMFRSLAGELAPAVRVNTVSPGVVPTRLNARRLADPDEVHRRIGRIPLGRLGDTDDVAAVVTFLLSDGAAWITGADFRVDGGETNVRVTQGNDRESVQARNG